MFQNFVKLSEDGHKNISSTSQVTASKPIRALGKHRNVACEPITGVDMGGTFFHNWLAEKSSKLFSFVFSVLDWN